MATFVIVFLTTRMILLLLIHYYVIKIVIKHVVIKKLKINLIKLNVKNVVVQMENMEINTQFKNEIPSTTTQEIITAHPTTASSSSYSYISYGCVIFDVAGDIYFNITNNSAQKCVEECLIKDKNFQFFITSFFGG